MDKVIGNISLQVFFEEPFWIGIFERVWNDELVVCKTTFGAEPKDYEINDFLKKNYYKLTFSPAVDSNSEMKEYTNPKRRQREVKRQVLNIGIGTKSQQALQLQREQGKVERKLYSRKLREADEKRLFEMKQQKKKEKHKGR